MRQRLSAIWKLIRRMHRWWLQTEPYITVLGSLAAALMTGFWAWVVSTIQAINALGWGVWLVLGLLLALVSLVTIAVAIWIADRIRTKSADRPSPQILPSISSDPAPNRSESQDGRVASREQFPPQYDELLALFLDYLAPVVYAHRALREAIVKKGVDNEKIRTLALRSLSDENLDRSFSFAAEPMSGSPAERPSFYVLTTSIHNAEFSYQECIAERDALARSVGLTIESDEQLFRLWDDWRRKHNALVKEYERIKRDQRFGILFRPFRESKWGGPIPPA